MSLLLYFSLCTCRINRAVEVDHTKILSGMQLDDGIVHTFVSIGRMSGIRATVIVSASTRVFVDQPNVKLISSTLKRRNERDSISNYDRQRAWQPDDLRQFRFDRGRIDLGINVLP
jgi:hypothetical protein